MFEKRPFDIDDYTRRSEEGPCFICEYLAGNPDYTHHLVYEDEATVAFLNKYPTLYGYVLVAPRRHKEQVTGDFSLDEYLAMQRVIYRLAEAVRLEVEAERVYILSLGSQQANRHVHWHIAPLPPGIPLEQQQCQAIDASGGYLDIPSEELAPLAERLNQRMNV